jgi:hypothetical protein
MKKYLFMDDEYAEEAQQPISDLLQIQHYSSNDAIIANDLQISIQQSLMARKSAHLG